MTTYSVMANQRLGPLVLASNDVVTVFNGGYTTTISIITGSKMTVQQGGVAEYTRVKAGGTEIVERGATDRFATLDAGTQTIFGVSSQATITSNGIQTIFGVANTATVGGFLATQRIESGGQAFDTTLGFAGTQVILAGASASRTILNSGQVEADGGISSSATVNDNAQVRATNQGQALATIINARGVALIEKDGKSIGTVVNAGGDERIGFRGTSSDAIINTNGRQTVFGTGARSLRATIAAGAAQVIGDATNPTNPLETGTSESAILQKGAIQTVNGTGISLRTNVLSGAYMYVAAGGVGDGTIIKAGGSATTIGSMRNTTLEGRMLVDTIGMSSMTAVSANAFLEVRFGTVTSTTVAADGVATLSAGGTAIDTIVSARGRLTLTGIKTSSANTALSGIETVDGQATATGTTVLASGTLIIGNGSTSKGTIVQSGGTEIVASQGRSDGAAIKAGGTLEIQAGGTATNTSIAIGGMLRIDGLAHSATDVATISVSNVLTISAGGITFTEQLSSAPPAFRLTDDGNGGTLAIGVASGSGGVRTTPVFRFFDTIYGTQFSTADADERDTIIKTRTDLVYEGTGGLNAIDPRSANTDSAAVPVFRFFDTRFGTHFFTASATERDGLLQTRPDLTYENVGFYEHLSQQQGDVPVYRFFDTVRGTHFYTADASENAAILAQRPDLKAEGIGFFAPGQAT